MLGDLVQRHDLVLPGADCPFLNKAAPKMDAGPSALLPRRVPNFDESLVLAPLPMAVLVVDAMCRSSNVRLTSERSTGELPCRWRDRIVGCDRLAMATFNRNGNCVIRPSIRTTTSLRDTFREGRRGRSSLAPCC